MWMFKGFFLCRNILFLLATDRILIYLCIKHVYESLRFNSLITWKMVISFRFSSPLENCIFYSPGNSYLLFIHMIFISLSIFPLKNFISLINLQQHTLKPWLHYGYIPCVFGLLATIPYHIHLQLKYNLMPVR